MGYYSDECMEGKCKHCTDLLCGHCNHIAQEDKNIKEEFVGYLVDNDIKNENGLKTLKQLIKEYPEEWGNFNI